MNIQTERLEDHTARVTVELDSQRLDEAKKQAAQQLSAKVNIPGFRRGKVPYRIMLNYVGEGAILEEAVELLSNDIYKEALPQTDLQPYGPGSLTDFDADVPSFIYTVPLQPTVDLKDYRELRLDYEAPEITDDAVNKAMRNLQEQHAVVEESHQSVASGNRVSVAVHSFIIEETDEADETAEAEATEAEDAEQVEGENDDVDSEEESADLHDHTHGEPFIHEHDAQYILDTDGEPVPGFSEALIGATPDETRTFMLSVPDDADAYGEAAGKPVEFNVTVKKIETVTLPELTDDFAARVTADEEKPLTLLELRIRVRENLVKMAEDRYRNDFMTRAIDALVEKAEIAFPEAMVMDQVQDMLEDLDQRLRQQGITLNDYMQIYRKSVDDFYKEYREPAEKMLKRSLVVREIVNREGLQVSDESVAAEIDKMVERFDEDRRDDVRKLFDNPSMRDNVVNDLLRDKVVDRVVAIARGEAPEAGNVENVEVTEEKGESA